MKNTETEQALTTARDQVRAVFDAGVSRVKGFNAVVDYLQEQPRSGDYYLLSVGKAGSSMALGALSVLGEQIKTGLVVTKHHHAEADLIACERMHVIESDHPLPGDASIKAGQAVLDFVQQAPADARFLVLFSGGASSLMEVLAEGMDLAQLTAMTNTLLSIGYDITQMNQVRRAASCIKGGRLASYINGRETLALMISDVPGDDPAVIGSGPLTPIYDNIAEVDLPADITSLLADVKFMPVPDSSAFTNIESHVIATLDDAKQAAAKHAQSLGLEVILHKEFMQGDASAKAAEISQQMSSAAAGIHIWGGETAVTLPSNPGRGGRNQHFALVAAKMLAGQEDVVLLAAGTDGTDGPTEDAGGIVDGSSAARAQQLDLDLEKYLTQADSGNCLEALGDLVTTGPTGTNVMDLVVALKR
jgi:hydroxypyruvate reductase|tara:strand:+ start:65089 stop:66342 length:1254 start_codon:yes stop_codon:yes gene_type:complete